MSTSGIMEYLPPVCAVNIVGSVITTCAFNVSKQYGVCDDEFVRSLAQLLKQLEKVDLGQGLEDVTITDWSLSFWKVFFICMAKHEISTPKAPSVHLACATWVTKPVPLGIMIACRNKSIQSVCVIFVKAYFCQLKTNVSLNSLVKVLCIVS